jgi:mono/diheme cytochrome c family protein
MRKHKNWLGLVMAVVAAIFLGFVAPAMADEADRHGMENDMPLPTEAAALENGKDRFQARCSYCHRPDGRGGSSGVCLACQKYKHGSRSSQIYATIAAGKPYTKMGAFASSLSSEEIMNIVAYIRELQEWKIKDDAAAPK